MTDEEALSEANRERDNVGEQFWSVSDIDPEFAAGFRAGLAHARQWRPLTADPASWPEEGQEVAILWRDRRTSTGTFRAVCGANAFDRLITHWLPLPEPPKGESK